MKAPVRLCCGQRHNGPVCPDGQVMCCICFGRFRQEDLNVLDNGKKEDVCKTCANKEKVANGYWIVELEANVYLAGWHGDPGKTSIRRNAIKYENKECADKAIKSSRANYRPFTDACAIFVNYST